MYFFSDKPDSTTFSSSPSSKPIHSQSLTLTCSSNGRPLPSYRIQSITGSNNATLLSNTTSGNYTISKISYTDYVDYNVTFRCVPHNFIGSGPSKDINLEVQGRSIFFISVTMLYWIETTTCGKDRSYCKDQSYGQLSKQMCTSASNQNINVIIYLVSFDALYFPLSAKQTIYPIISHVSACNFCKILHVFVICKLRNWQHQVRAPPNH